MIILELCFTDVLSLCDPAVPFVTTARAQNRLCPHSQSLGALASLDSERQSMKGLAQGHCVGLLWPDISGLAIRNLRLGNFTFVPGLTDGCEVPFQAARVLNARLPAAYTNCTRHGLSSQLWCLCERPAHAADTIKSE